MGLSRRKQEQVGAEVRAALGDFAAAVEVRLHAELDRSVRTQLALAKAVKGLRDDIAQNNDELARALEALGRAIEYDAEVTKSDRLERRAQAEVDRLERRTLAEADRLERRALADADRLERRALIEAVAYLAQTLTDHDRLPALPHDIDMVLERELISPEPDIDLAALSGGVPAEPPANGTGTANGNGTANGHGTANGTPRPAGHGSEVQCYIEGQWIDGFEVCDVVGSSENRRYRVRRMSDGSVLRKLLAGHEVRFDRAERPSNGTTRGGWFAG